MQWLFAFLKLMPMVLELVRLIQLHRLTEEATDEMIADLEMTAEYLVTRANKARDDVKDTPEDIENDPFNVD
jgi:5-methylcytosine-specific restriction endonuclease McrBC GTP-binding regulatory subunit McrB